MNSDLEVVMKYSHGALAYTQAKNSSDSFKMLGWRTLFVEILGANTVGILRGATSDNMRTVFMVV
jgi:hypothetical protein